MSPSSPVPLPPRTMAEVEPPRGGPNPGDYSAQEYASQSVRDSDESLTLATNLSLLQAQRARRAAQEDAQRLANRLAQLQKEESKSEKRIDETRKRSEEIRALRKRNEEKVGVCFLATKIGALTTLPRARLARREATRGSFWAGEGSRPAGGGGGVACAWVEKR